MPEAVLTISSRNYSSWSLRGWLLCKLAGLDLTEEEVPIDTPGQRAELLLLSPSVLVPRLTHEGASVWDTLAIAEYLNERFPMPASTRRIRWRARIAGRSRARSIRASTICARRCR